MAEHAILGEHYSNDFWRIRVVDALDAWQGMSEN